jgi:hypothetical protein
MIEPRPVTIMIRVPEAFRRKLRIRLAAAGESLQAFVLRAIARELRRPARKAGA